MAKWAKYFTRKKSKIVEHIVQTAQKRPNSHKIVKKVKAIKTMCVQKKRPKATESDRKRPKATRNVFI